MGNKWILDVLADLKAFAEVNDMPRLADQLDITAVVAAAEIVTGSDFGKRAGEVIDAAAAGRGFGEVADRRSA